MSTKTRDEEVMAEILKAAEPARKRSDEIIRAGVEVRRRAWDEIHSPKYRRDAP